MTDQRTELESLGEFGLIDELTKDFTAVNPETLLGVGDDAAVIDIGNDLRQVVSTDLLIEGVHFDLTYMPLKHLGYKAIAVNPTFAKNHFGLEISKTTQEAYERDSIYWKKQRAQPLNKYQVLNVTQMVGNQVQGGGRCNPLPIAPF